MLFPRSVLALLTLLICLALFHPSEPAGSSTCAGARSRLSDADSRLDSTLDPLAEVQTGQEPAPRDAKSKIPTKDWAGYLDQVKSHNVGDFRSTYDLFVSFSGAVDDGLGATFAPVDSALRAQLGLPEGQGLTVSSTASEGPAESAGLKPNDIILTLGDSPVQEVETLTKLLKASGQKVMPMRVIRAGKPVELKIRAVYQVSLAPAETQEPEYFLGIQSTPVDSLLRSHLEIPEGRGLVVNKVVEGSPAAKVGLKVGDILLAASANPLADTDTLVAEIQATKGKSTMLQFIRSGKAQTVEITPEARPRSERSGLGRVYYGDRITPDASNSLYRYLIARPQGNIQWWKSTPSAELNNAWSYWQAVRHPDGVDAYPSSAGSKQPEDLKHKLDALDKNVAELRALIEELLKAEAAKN